MNSIKHSIITYLGGRDYVYGGVIDDHIRSLHGAKASNASRRCRELENEGLIEVRRVQAEGKGPLVTQYRLKRIAPIFMNKQLSLI